MNLGNKWCPWTWAYDVKNNRIPQRIAYANCTKSSCDETVCAKIYFDHQVLTKKKYCDNKTGDKYRKLTSVSLPIAIVYTGKPN